MHKLFIITLLVFMFAPAAFSTEQTNLKTNSSNAETLNKNISMLGAGVLGVVLASGIVGLISSASMMYEGTAFVDAMESGAGLPMPVVFLSAVLGAVFGQDFVQKNIQSLQANGEPVR